MSDGKSGYEFHCHKCGTITLDAKSDVFQHVVKHLEALRDFIESGDDVLDAEFLSNEF